MDGGGEGAGWLGGSKSSRLGMENSGFFSRVCSFSACPLRQSSKSRMETSSFFFPELNFWIVTCSRSSTSRMENSNFLLFERNLFLDSHLSRISNPKMEISISSSRISNLIT